MIRLNIHEAKTHLSRYARKVKAGETIILCDRNEPFAEIRPLPKRTKKPARQLGASKGTAILGDHFEFDASELAALTQAPLVSGTQE